MTIENRTHILTGSLFALYFVISMVSYFVLSSVFQFPDILREDPVTRFGLFRANQAIIVPTYYFWACTGTLQVVLAAMVFSTMQKKGPLAILGLVFGILSGAFQLVGYIRWVVFIPLLSAAYSAGEISSELTFVIEKLANGYLGMTVGEHLGNFFLGLWMAVAGISFFKSSVVHKSLAHMGWIIGGCFFLYSFEPLGALFAPLSLITVPMWGGVYVWFILLSISFLRYKGASESPPLHWGIWVACLLFWLGNVVPAYM